MTEVHVAARDLRQVLVLKAGEAHTLVIPRRRSIEGSFFAVRLVNEAGQPLEGVEITIHADGGHRVVTTPAGVARVDGVNPGSAPVTLVDVPATRALLEVRGASPNSTGQPPSSQVAILPVRTDSDPVNIESDQQQTIVLVLPPKEVHVVEVEDGMFRLDSAVVLPEAERPSTDEHEALTTAGVFSAAVLFAAGNPDRRVLVAGHTDTSGTEAHNQDLSALRAVATLCCLEGTSNPSSRETFGTTCDARHLIADYKQILSWAAQQFGFSCDPGEIDNNEFTGIAPIKAFQRDYNVSRADLGVPDAEELKVDGSMGPKTWKAVFDCYEAALAAEISEAATVSERLAELAQLRSSLRFVDAARRSQGFGEHHTIDQIGRDNVRSQTNRRVEILYFNQGEEPDLDQGPTESAIYTPGVYTRVHIDTEAPAQVVELRLCDPLGDPIAQSPCTVTVGMAVRNRAADGQGRVTIVLPAERDAMLVDWADPGRGRTFSQNIFFGSERSDADGDRRLHNLGYSGASVSEKLEVHRADFGRDASVAQDALLAEALAWHDGGARPVRSGQAGVKQAFPAAEP